MRASCISILLLLAASCSHPQPQDSSGPPRGISAAGTSAAGMTAGAHAGSAGAFTPGGGGALATAGSATGAPALAGMQAPPPSAGTQAPSPSAGSSAAAGGPSAAGAPQVAGAGGNAGTTAPSGATELWVSPSGDDAGPGTQAAPFKTLVKAVAGLRPGMTIRVMPGTYASTETVKLAADGSADQPLRIFAAEGGARPQLDFSAQPRGQSSARGFEITGTYWHIKGLEGHRKHERG